MVLLFGVGGLSYMVYILTKGFNSEVEDEYWDLGVDETISPKKLRIAEKSEQYEIN